jgi:para-nitrobenzyl esterase
VYRFDWPSPVRGGVLGAHHALDLPFTFDRLDAPELLGEEPPRALARTMRGAWARFAATGDPNGGDLVPWPRYDLRSRPVLLLDVPCQVVEDPRSEIRRLWESASAAAPTAT